MFILIFYVSLLVGALLGIFAPEGVDPRSKLTHRNSEADRSTAKRGSVGRVLRPPIERPGPGNPCVIRTRKRWTLRGVLSCGKSPGRETSEQRVLTRSARQLPQNEYAER